MDLMTDANFSPSCTRAILVVAGVFPSKNVIQFFLITAMVAAEPLLAGELLVAGLDAGAAGVVELELLLEQAVTAAASARPNAGARKIRRAM
jgi:hypothetical protein